MNERMTKLEIRVAFLEKTLEDLDGVVRELGGQLAMLHREIKAMREEGAAGEPAPAEAEAPPHY